MMDIRATMSSEPNPDREAQYQKLKQNLEEAEANLKRIRKQNSELSDDFRNDPSEAKRERLKRGAEALTTARDQIEAEKVALAIFEKSGSPYGLLARDGQVIGMIAVRVPPGSSHERRLQLIHEALTGPLHETAGELGAVLAASPERYVKERPGRDADGKTVLDVAGRVEGDRLVPALSKAEKRRA